MFTNHVFGHMYRAMNYYIETHLYIHRSRAESIPTCCHWHLPTHNEVGGQSYQDQWPTGEHKQRGKVRVTMWQPAALKLSHLMAFLRPTESICRNDMECVAS